MEEAMIRAACTIVSLNYLAYARTLCESFLRFHPNLKFYVLLVDRLPEDIDLAAEPFELLLVENLDISYFKAVAFKYGVVELNTNVKPTFLKKLMGLGIDHLIYFDPDILICSRVDIIYEALETNAIIITPHCTSPNNGDLYAELLLLRNGVFNLGFIAVSKTEEAHRFLTWWEDRCLSSGYSERWTGLFVDQKWINLVPCYFDSITVLKHSGCNVAYWNLHERVLEETTGSWIVNGEVPLVFFHFSGINVDGGSRISKYTDQFTLESRPDLMKLFSDYRDRLIQYGIRNNTRHRYAFGHYSNGKLITNLQRYVFAANLDKFGANDPFIAEGPFYTWAKRHHLLSTADSAAKFGPQSYRATDTRVRIVNTMLRLTLRMLGGDRYTILMKYFAYVSDLRNQKDIIGGDV
jgi:hypothetical protein